MSLTGRAPHPTSSPPKRSHIGKQRSIRGNLAVIYQRCSQKSDLAPSSNIFSEVRRSELLPIIIMNSLHMTLVDQGLCKVNHLLLSENKIIKILVFETINYRRCSSENDK